MPAFHMLTQSVSCIMRNLGYVGITVQLDDFHIVGKTYDKCLHKMYVLIMGVVRRSGFWIDYFKIQMPSQRVTFIGVVLDSNKMVSELPPDKVEKLTAELKTVYALR